MRLPWTAGVAWGLAFAAVVAPKPARACSMPACVASTLPEAGRTIPRTAHGFFIHDSWTDSIDPRVSPVVVDTETGVEIPSTVSTVGSSGLRAVTWSNLPAETSGVTLRRPGCGGGPTTETAVRLGPAAPFPTVLGEILVSPSVEKVVTEVPAPCAPVQRVVAEVTTRVVLAPEVQPWIWALRFRVEVDGVPVEAPDRPRYPYATFAEWYGPDQTFRVRTPCPTREFEQTIAIIAEAVGEPILRTETRVVRVRCDGGSGGGGPRDGGASDLGQAAPSDGGASPDAGATASDAAETPSPPDGCSASGVPPQLLALLAALAALKPRSRGSSGSPRPRSSRNPPQRGT